ncbi:MAG: hypothetical protein DMG61_08900 [Acidobacteria bacterium]|nr:MAG: hypothetical protein DMG61_08900 [Acidobacteriota bacterium]PYY20322.1 MAG: hypothetical protein DMG60_00620 [Acidobacteriota bacterium]
MNQEISISYRAVKSKIYKLIDALVEGEKNEAEVQESIQRWWKMVRPDDRAVAEKYLAMVLNRSNASLLAIRDGVHSYEHFSVRHNPDSRVGNRLPAA